MSEALIQRVYDVRVSNIDDSLEKVKALTEAFHQMDAAKTKLNAQLQQKLTAGDQSAIANLTKQIKDLESEMAKLKGQRDSAAKEAELLSRAEKNNAAALKDTAAATLTTVKAEQVRSQIRISENVARQKELDLQEKQRIKLENERAAVIALEGSYALLKQRRQELENLITKATPTSTITFQNNNLSFDQAITQLKLLKSEELDFTEKLRIEKTVHDEINKSTTENQALVDGREKILQLRMQQEEEQRLLALENERLATQKSSTELGTFNIPQGSGQVSNAGLVNRAPQVETFVPATDLERNILQLVRTKEALAGIQTEQKNLKQQLTEGVISQNEFDSAIVKATQIELEFKKTIAATNAEIKATSNIDATVAGSIKNLEALNRSLSLQRDAIPVVNPTAGEVEEVKAINAELDKNNELIRINKDLLAQQKINIGNYAGSFKSALTVLETELTSINTQLKSGLGGTDIENLTRKQTVLTEAISLATRETTTASDAQRNYREAVHLLGVEFGTDSQVFKNFTSQVSSSVNSLNELQSSLIRNTEGAGSFANAFKELGLSSVLREQQSAIVAQLNQLKSEAVLLAAEFRRTGQSGKESFALIDNQLKVNLEQQEQLKRSLQSLDSALHNTGNVGTQISSSISEGFKNAKQQIGQLLATYIGFQAAFQGAISLLHTNEVLSDSFADLRIRIHGTTDDVDKLFTSLKKIDTRTSLTGLVDIANVVAKKGVAQEQIAGVTQALDQLFVVLGKEAGEPHEATASLVKLISIFNDDKHVTAERVNEIGTSLFKLTTSGVATGSFLINFAERVGAVRGITGLTLPNILGMGAALQQLGQKSEVAGTAAVQLATKMFSNVPKFAEAAGKSVADFRKLLDANPFEALVAVAENLKKVPDELLKDGSNKFEEVIKSFAEVGVSGNRIKTVLADIATNADFVRQKMGTAAVTTADYGNQAAAADLKQRSFAATIERITKAFETFGTSKTVQVLLLSISSVVLALLTSLPLLLGVLTLLGIAWVAQNQAIALLNLQLFGYRALLLGLNIVQGAAALVNGILTASLFVLNGAYTLVTRAAAFFNFTVGKTPLGLIIGGISLLVAGLISAKQAFGDTVAVLDRFSLANKINAEVIAEAARSTTEARGQAQLYLKAVNDLSLSEKTRISFLQKLIDIDPAFKNTLVNGQIQYHELTKALNEYNNSLRLSSELEASRIRNAGEFKKLTDLQAIKQEIETAKATRDFSKLSDQARDILASAVIKSTGVFGTVDLSKEGLAKQADAATKIVDNQINKQLEVVDAAQKIFLGKQENIDTATKAANEARIQDLKNQVKSFDDAIKNFPKSGSKEDLDAYIQFRDSLKADLAKVDSVPVKVTPIEIDIDGLKRQLADLDKQIKAFKGSQSELDNLINQRAALKAKLDDALGKETKTPAFRGSRLSGEDVDLIRLEDAKANEQIAKQKLLFKQLTIDEETYLTNVLKINEDATDKKLKILNKKPVSQQNAEEKKRITELQLFAIEEEEKTNKQIFDIRKQQLDATVEDIRKTAQLELATITDSPVKTQQEKLQAKQQFLVQDFILQTFYNQKVTDLEAKYNQNSIKGEQQRKSAITKSVQELNKTKVDLQIGVLGQIQSDTDKEVALIKLRYDKLIKVVEDSNKTVKQKTDEISKINLVANVEIGAVKLTGANKLKEAAQVLFDAGLISAEQFEKIFNGAIEAQKALSDSIDKTKLKFTSIKDLADRGLAKLFGFEEGSEAAKQWSIIVQQAFDLAGQAMNSYFEQEQQRIERSKELNLKRIDIELGQAEKLAQSQGERDSLERQFQSKRDEENRKAFEKDKKLKKEQLTINYAIQLANIAVAASANPLNPFTFGAAGIAQYIIQAAIATAGYLLNLGNINKAQYAFGGRVRREDIKQVQNGRIDLAQNIPTQPNGDNILATVRTGEVILNDEQQRKLGGAKTFRDIGVPGFAAGGATSAQHDDKKSDYDLYSLIRGDKKELFKYIDEHRDRNIEKEKQSFKNLMISETTYLKNIFRINEEAASTKISILQSDINRVNTNQSSINTSSTGINQLDDQRKQITELSIYKIEQEAETNAQIFSIKKSWLDKHYENITLKSERQLNKITDDPDVKDSDKQRARRSYITDSYVTGVLHHGQIDNLKKEYNQFGRSNKFEGSNKTTSDTLNSIHESTEQSISTIKQKYDTLREEIVNSNKSESQKRKSLSALSKVENIETVTRQLQAESDKIHTASKLLRTNQITSNQFEEVINKSTVVEQHLNTAIHSITDKANKKSTLSRETVSKFYNTASDTISKFVIAKNIANGLITTAPNIPTRANGDNILATVKQGEVILNEGQQRQLGGARTFRAIGVPGFGGTKHKEIKEYYAKAFASGGFTGLGDIPLGDSLHAPINPSSFLNPTSANASRTDQQIKELMGMVAATNAAVNETSRQTNQRIDKIKVQVVTQEITNSQNKITKATSIGTL